MIQTEDYSDPIALYGFSFGDIARIVHDCFMAACEGLNFEPMFMSKEYDNLSDKYKSAWHAVVMLGHEFVVREEESPVLDLAMRLYKRWAIFTDYAEIKFEELGKLVFVWEAVVRCLNHVMADREKVDRLDHMDWQSWIKKRLEHERNKQ